MNNEFILESMASDLKRVALSLYRGSDLVARRFIEEARKRRNELNTKEIAPYIKKLINNLGKKMTPDDALMYSTLIQNYTQHKKF